MRRRWMLGALLAAAAGAAAWTGRGATGEIGAILRRRFGEEVAGHPEVTRFVAALEAEVGRGRLAAGRLERLRVRLGLSEPRQDPAFASDLEELVVTQLLEGSTVILAVETGADLEFLGIRNPYAAACVVPFSALARDFS